MFQPSRCAVVLAIMIGVAAVACGATDNEPPEAGGNPSDAPIPDEFRIETPTATAEVREYYKGIRLKGLEDVYSFLMVTQNGGSQPSRSYELTEYQTNFGVGLTKTRWAGNLTIEPVPGKRAGIDAYRLDAGVSPNQPRVFVKMEDTLYLPKDPTKLSDFLDYTDTLSYAAKATNGRVEVDHGILSGHVPPTNIRLGVGEVLVVRLGPSHSVVSEATPAPVRQEGSREDPGGWVVMTFRAVAPASADLVRIDPPTDKHRGRRIVIAGIKVESPKPAAPG